jgi:MFS family permease
LNGMAAVYATSAGLPLGKVALFLSLPMIGGIAFQFPMSSASDDLDRRAVALASSLLAAGAAVHLAFARPGSLLSYAVLLGLGGLTYPLYSFAAAYTNDWTPQDKLVGAASQLVLLYGVGAVAGPLLASIAMSAVGPRGFFWTIAALHVVLAGFLGYRMRAWRAPLVDRPWRDVSYPARVFFLPATLAAVGRRVLRERATSTND